MLRLIAPGFALALLVGCGSDGNGSPGTGGTSASAGSTASGGTATGGASSGGIGGAGTGGKSGAGGAATGGKSGTGGAGTGGKPGAGGTGGRPSTGGAGAGGNSSMGGAPTAPQGPVDTCREDICPLGPCDNGGFFSDEKCSDVYPNPVSKDSMFCAAGVDGGYCLTTITNVLTYWAITCAGGTPTFNLCNAGCKVMADVAGCN